MCSLETGSFYRLFRELGIIKSTGYFWGIQEKDIEELNIIAPEIFSLIRPDYVEIKIENLIKAYIQNNENIYKACSVFSLDATIIELSKLPEIVKINVKSIFDDSDSDMIEEEANDSLLQSTYDEKSEKQDEFIVKISSHQVNEIAIKIADEMEARLRKLLLEFK